MKNTALLVRHALLASALVIPSGCQAATTESQAAPKQVSAPLEAPTAEDAANATYTGIYEAPITLSAGRYEGEPFEPDGASRPTVGLLDDLQLVADLDGDGVDERVVLLWESSGGSGTRVYVALVRPGGGAVATLVGDRVETRTLRVQGALLQMDVLRAGADDAMCCPGELASIRWRASEEGLVVVSDESIGRLDLAAIAGEWKRVPLNTGLRGRLLRVDPDDPEARETWILSEGETRALGLGLETAITLVIGAAGGVSGRSGCNQYSGSARFSGPNELAFGPLRMTLIACSQPVLAAEQEFLSRLQAVTRVGFHLGKLALSWQSGDGESGTLLFEPQ